MDQGPVSSILSHRITRRSFSASVVATTGLAFAGLIGRAAMAQAGPVAGARVTVTTDALNVRDQPSLSGNVVGVEYAGTTGVMTGNGAVGDGYSWLEVQFPDVTGWSVTDYLAQGGADGQGAVGPDYPVGTAVTVAVDGLNVRDAAGLSGSVVAVESYGATGETTSATTDADGYVWAEVSFADASGWVATEFLTAAPGPNGGDGGNQGSGGSGDVAPGDTIKVVDGPLNIRSGPGTSYDVIDVAATGAIAQVIDGPSGADGYTWIKISGNELAVGWVAFEFCTVV